VSIQTAIALGLVGLVASVLWWVKRTLDQAP
jgi:hypothetical protein